MTDAETASGGSNASSGGTSVDSEVNGNVADPPTPTPPDDLGNKKHGMTDEEHRTLQKALDEKKKVAARLEQAEQKLSQIERENKEKEEQRLRKNQEWQKLAELREQEAKEAKEKFERLNQTVEQTEKMTSVLQAMKGEIDPKYWGMIKPRLDEIPINPDSGLPDEVAVQNVAQSFQEQFPEVVKVRNSANLPGEAANPAKPFAPSQWNSLSPADKKENLPQFVEQRLKEIK